MDCDSLELQYFRSLTHIGQRQAVHGFPRMGHLLLPDRLVSCSITQLRVLTHPGRKCRQERTKFSLGIRFRNANVHRIAETNRSSIESENAQRFVARAATGIVELTKHSAKLKCDGGVRRSGNRLCRQCVEGKPLCRRASGETLPKSEQSRCGDTITLEVEEEAAKSYTRRTPRSAAEPGP